MRIRSPNPGSPQTITVEAVKCDVGDSYVAVSRARRNCRGKAFDLTVETRSTENYRKLTRMLSDPLYECTYLDGDHILYLPR
jgi:hypothetical protein